MYQKIITPYLTDYSTPEEANNAWNSGKDFILHDISSQWDGKPCCSRDFPKNEQLKLRFKKKREFLFVKGSA